MKKLLLAIVISLFSTSAFAVVHVPRPIEEVVKVEAVKKGKIPKDKIVKGKIVKVVVDEKKITE